MSQTTDWVFKPDVATPFDPLLECLLVLAKYYNKPTSARSIISGLPLVDNKLTPELFKRAANRIGLAAKITNTKIDAIASEQLPAVLFLKNGQAAILQNISDIKTAQVIQPESDAGCVELPISELQEKYLGYVIFVKPSFELASYTDGEPKKIAAKNWCWEVFRKALPIYSEVLAASVLINLFTIASPLFVMNVYDRVVPNNAIETLWVLAIGVIIVFGFDFLMRNLRAYFIDFVGKKIDIELSSYSFSQLMGLQMGSRPPLLGALTNMVNGFQFFRDFITSASVSLLIDLPFTILFILVMAMIGGYVALVPLAIIPLMLLSSFIIQKPLDRLVAGSHDFNSESNSILIESLVGAEALKCARAEGLMQRKWEDLSKVLAKFGVKMRLLANIGTNIAIYAQQIATVGVVIVGVYEIAASKMTVGALIACVILLGRTLAPVAQVAAMLTKYKQSKNSLASLDKVMQMPTERPLGKNFLHRSDLKGNIEFKNVDFAYANQTIPALKDISFKINHGERVGVIGRVGSGKTTLEKLLLKLYAPSSGAILVDGTEIDQLDPTELRYHIGYVPQDVMLFHGTIRDNIVLSAPYVDDVTVMRAAKLSGVASFVNQHPEGFARKVHERGENLSGGQKQAIALARALLLDPPILIFDEPCNSMDETTIDTFMQELHEFAKDKTLLIISHKFSLLKLVERLLVLDNGRLVVDGPKDAILAKLAASQGKAAEKSGEI